MKESTLTPVTGQIKTNSIAVCRKKIHRPNSVIFLNMCVSYIVKLETDETVITNNDQGEC